MFYKRKQIYWIDGLIGSHRIKMCTGFKDKKRTQDFYFNLMGGEMIQICLSTNF